MIDSSLKDIAAALRAKTVSAVELATDSLARIQARDGQINAFVTVDEADALAAARAEWLRIQRGIYSFDITLAYGPCPSGR